MLVTKGGATTRLFEVVQGRVTVGEVGARRGDRGEERQPQVMLAAEKGAAAEGHARPKKEWLPDPIVLVAIVVMEGGATAGEEERLSKVVLVMEERSQDPVTDVVTEGEAASGEEGGAARQTDKE